VSRSKLRFGFREIVLKIGILQKRVSQAQPKYPASEYVLGKVTACFDA
jgi:hypothetical protein